MKSNKVTSNNIDTHIDKLVDIFIEQQDKLSNQVNAYLSSKGISTKEALWSHIDSLKDKNDDGTKRIRALITHASNNGLFGDHHNTWHTMSPGVKKEGAKKALKKNIGQCGANTITISDGV